MNKKLEKLEQKFGMATKLVNELTEVVEELPLAIVEVELQEEEQVFSITALKTDFLLVRNSILKLVQTGQRVLDTASLLDVSDMKGSHLQAISDMQSTIGNNLKLLISIYKEISEIEKLRLKDKPAPIVPSTVVMGNSTNNQILFSGSSEELLTMIRENQNL